MSIPAPTQHAEAEEVKNEIRNAKDQSEKILRKLEEKGKELENLQKELKLVQKNRDDLLTANDEVKAIIRDLENDLKIEQAKVQSTNETMETQKKNWKN